MTKVDYIILGAGASGLMLAYRMAQDPFFDDRSVLIIDKEKNKGNDRTWCYWEEGHGEWDNLLHKSWPKIYFGSSVYSKTIDLESFNYKMIRSADFYEYLWTTISKKPNFKFVTDEVISITENTNDVLITTTQSAYNGSMVFNSIPNSNDYKEQNKFPVLKQHFVGWFIETETDCFDESTATFMDFTVNQKGNTRFMYILPLDKRTALFEYTLFSKDLLPFEDYEEAIKGYLRTKGIENFRIIEKEKGSIPMTSFKFSDLNTKNILNIGTAGGWTKASTGYTFRNTTKKTKLLVEFLKQNDNLTKFHKRTKFWFYDLLFLDVLANHNEEGSKLFATLFKNAQTKTILRFLDEETNLYEDFKIITSVPPKNFLNALIKRLF